MKPRDYQLACVDAFFDYWASGPPTGRNAIDWGHPVAALPTGTGKSIIIGEFCRRACTFYPGTKILVITHVKELVEQDFLKLLELWPTAPAGIYSAGLNRKDIGRDITFCGIGSVAKAVQYFAPDLIFIDECHTVSPKEATIYRKAISYWMGKKPDVKVAGLSATPYRLGQGMIVEPGGIFTDICFDLTTKEAFNWFISEGYLKTLIPKRPKTEYDISGVHIASTGDYNQKELQAAVDKDALTRSAVSEMLIEAGEREHWLVFAAGIQHAEHVAAILVENGISAVCVHSKSTDAERDQAVLDFKAGRVRALVNNGVFTTGFDFPGIDYIAVLRHTTSPGLWVQMLGRGTRPDWELGLLNCKAGERWDLSTREGRLACIAAGRPNCLVSDFARNTERLGPINDPKRPASKKQKDKPGDAPAKACEVCMCYNFASARFCSECGAEFIFKVKVTTKSSNKELIAGALENQEPIEEYFEVDTVSYSKHTPWNGKKRGPFNNVLSSLRVTYNCPGLRAFTEYVNFDHEGHPGVEARRWWSRATKDISFIPKSVDQACANVDSLKKPKRVRVWINRPNPKVQYIEFPES